MIITLRDNSKDPPGEFLHFACGLLVVLLALASLLPAAAAAISAALLPAAAAAAAVGTRPAPALAMAETTLCPWD
jgi:hypothetical protein